MKGIETVAVVGAGGFLGANLAPFLAPRVRDLRCYGRRCSFPEVFSDLRWITGNITDENLGDVLDGCDVVIHLASTSTPATADRDIVADAEANVIGTLRLLECCVAKRVGRIVFLSSGGTVYGIPTIVPTPEDAATNPISAYGAAKLSIEKYLEIFRRHHGLDYRILRVSNIYGPHQTAEKGQGVIAAFLSRALDGRPLEIWGDGEIIRDYIYVSDVVDAIWKAMNHHGEVRILNIGSGRGTSINQIASAIEKRLGRPLDLVFRPGRPVDVPTSILDCSLASRELDWCPQISLDTGLDLLVNWIGR
jgi:UDP-glucose 4-epimerase